MPDQKSPAIPADTIKDEDARDEAAGSQLAREVAVWAADRSDAARPEVAADVGIARPRLPARSKSAAKRTPKPVSAEPAVTARKPFAMSYGGVSSRTYLDQVIERRGS